MGNGVAVPRKASTKKTLRENHVKYTNRKKA